MGFALTRRFALAVAALGLAFAAGGAQAQTYPDYNLSPVAPDATGMDSTAAQLVARMGLGWNIGNTLEAIGGETAWGNPQVTPELITLVKANGFSAIRIPASWDQFSDQRTGEIRADRLQRIEEVVRYALDQDLIVVLNIHWDGGWLENHVTEDAEAGVSAKQRAFWQQIATHFRDFDERLIFASANEPNVETAEQMAVLMRHHQTFIDAVRATGGRNSYRALVVQGPATDFEKTHNLWRAMPTDTVADRLIMELHFYTPYNFTLMTEDQSWGRQFYYWGREFHDDDASRNPTYGEEQQIAGLFGLVRRQFVDQGIPVIIGEYGAMRRDNLRGEERERHLASRAYYLGFVTHQAVLNGMAPFYWDSGAIDSFGSGLFDRRRDRVFDEPALAAIREGARLARTHE